MPKLSLIALLVAAATISHAHAQQLSPRLDLQVGGTADATSVDGGVILPFAIAPGVIAYGDFRAAVDRNGNITGAAGAGVRAEVGDGWRLGGHGYFDLGQGALGTTFQQVSAGIEALGHGWEFRLNGYLPVGKTEAEFDELTTVTVENEYLAIRQGYEVALHGVEAEVGVVLPVFAEDEGRTLKLLANAYHFDSDYTDARTGGGLRAEVTVAELDAFLPGAELTFGAGVNYDSRDELTGTGFLRISAPLGGDELVERIERRKGVMTEAGALGDAQAALFSDGTATGKVASISGTTSDLNGVIGGAGENGIILASGDITVDETLELAAGQLLLGGGGVVQLIAADSGKSVSYTNTGATTTFRGSETGEPEDRVDVIAMATGATVATLSITGGGAAISAVDADDVTITDVAIARSQNGIVLNNVVGGRISDVSIEDIVCATDCTYSIYDPNVIKNAGISAVGVQDLMISDVTMEDVAHGVFIASTIDENGDITDQAEDIHVSGLTIHESRGEGLYFMGVTNATADDIELINDGPVIELDNIVVSNSTDISLSNLHLVGGSNGVVFVSEIPLGIDVSGITVTDALIEDVYGAGFMFQGGTNITLENVHIDGANNGLTFAGISEISNIDLINVSAANIASSGNYINPALLTFLYNDVENIDGDITYTGAAPDLCGYASITQASGKQLSVNGTVVDQDAIDNAPSCF